MSVSYRNRKKVIKRFKRANPDLPPENFYLAMKDYLQFKVYSTLNGGTGISSLSPQQLRKL